MREQSKHKRTTEMKSRETIEYKGLGGGEIPKDWKHKEDLKHNGNTYKIYLNIWNDTYVATFKGRVAPAFGSLSDVKEYIKEGKLNYAEGGVVYLYYGGEEDYKTIKVSSQAEAEKIAMWNGAEHWDYVKD